jgi:hypothetical protein
MHFGADSSPSGARSRIRTAQWCRWFCRRRIIF